jgi:hypothetical protein
MLNQHEQRIALQMHRNGTKVETIAYAIASGRRKGDSVKIREHFTPCYDEVVACLSQRRENGAS